MDEQNSQAGSAEPISTPYKDRSTGLIVFGILTIFLGAFAGLMVLMILGQLAAPHAGASPAPTWSLVPVVLMYLVTAVALIWLGIGSILARRWARALLLIISWSWLAAGVIAIVSMLFIMPKILAGVFSGPNSNKNQALPESAEVAAMVVMGLVFGVFFVIMPVIWTAFYRSPHVKATCEARDSKSRWTDACPLPVLALCLWFAMWLPWLLGMPLSGHVVIPFFGMFLTGLPGGFISFVLAAICICAVWLLYKIDTRGWWLALIAMVLYWISGVLTYSRHNLIEMYQLMGYSPAQLEQVQKFGSSGVPLAWISSLLMVPFIIYILFIKRYLRGTSPR